MLLGSFRASNGRYLSVDAAAASQLVASSEFPDASCEFLIDHLARPQSNRLMVGDRLEIRSPLTNMLWHCAPSRDGAAVPVRADRRLPPYTRTLSQTVVVTDVNPTLDLRLGLGVKLGMDTPSMILAAGGGGGGISTEEIFRSGFESNGRLSLVLDAANRLETSPFTSTRDLLRIRWFLFVPHAVRLALKSRDGRYLSLATGRTPEFAIAATASGIGLSQDFTFTNMFDALRDKLHHADRVTVRAPNGRMLNDSSGSVQAAGGTVEPLFFLVERTAGAGEVRQGDSITLTPFIPGGAPELTPRRLCAPSGGATAVIRTAPTDGSDVFTVDYFRDLRLQWNGAQADNASSTKAPRTGYADVRPQARIYIGPRPGTVPLKSFFHAGRGDTIATATVQGEEAAMATTPPYTFLGIEGYVHPESEPGTVPLKQYWHEGRADNMLGITLDDERAIADAGYAFAWIEGHAHLPDTGLVAAGLAPGTVAPGPYPARPIKALVLSGGGAKGCFEAGAAQKLWATGYRPDMICGVSVGAVNGTYLALNHEGAENELVDMWLTNSGRPGSIFREGHYFNVLGTLGERVAGRAMDTGIATLITGIAGLPGALIGFFSAKAASELDGAAVRLVNFAITLSHAMHSMEPLRLLLRSVMNADRLRQIRESRVRLHVGFTDMKTGHYVNASVAEPGWTDPQISDCMRLNVEPDHQLGETWLTRPIFGAPYVMPLVDAVYASAALPGFMEPMGIDLPASRRVTTSTGMFTRLATSLPPGLAELLAATNAGSSTGARYLESVDWAAVERTVDGILARFPMAQLRDNVLKARANRDGRRGAHSRFHYLFDGGLRDTMPIRTALRLGATEITVITGDQFQRAQHSYSTPIRLDPTLAGGVFDLLSGSNWMGTDLGQTPAARHILGLLGMWFNESARADLLLAMAHGDALSWLHRALERMDPAARRELQTQYSAEAASRGRIRYENLGATTPLGGTPAMPHPFGRPFESAGVTIRLIAPDRDILGPLDFENHAGVQDGIRLGAVRAETPVTIVAA